MTKEGNLEKGFTRGASIFIFIIAIVVLSTGVILNFETYQNHKEFMDTLNQERNETNFQEAYYSCMMEISYIQGVLSNSELIPKNDKEN